MATQQSRKTDLVAQAFACNYRNFIADALVGLEIEGELRIVTLNDDLGGLLYSLCSDATHDAQFCAILRVVECNWQVVVDRS